MNIEFDIYTFIIYPNRVFEIFSPQVVQMILIKIMVYAELGQNPHFTCHNVIDI